MLLSAWSVIVRQRASIAARQSGLRFIVRKTYEMRAHGSGQRPFMLMRAGQSVRSQPWKDGVLIRGRDIASVEQSSSQAHSGGYDAINQSCSEVAGVPASPQGRILGQKARTGHRRLKHFREVLRPKAGLR